MSGVEFNNDGVDAKGNLFYDPMDHLLNKINRKSSVRRQQQNNGRRLTLPRCISDLTLMPPCHSLNGYRCFLLRVFRRMQCGCAPRNFTALHLEKQFANNLLSNNEYNGDVVCVYGYRAPSYINVKLIDN